MDQLHQLGAGEEHRIVQGAWHEVTSVVLASKGFSALVFNELLAVDVAISIVDVDATFKDVSFTLK